MADQPSAEDLAGRRLLQIKLFHTAAWAVFASAIVAIPVATLLGRLDWAFWLSVLVWFECLILLANRMRCPLTGVAARYTEDRRGNFDIFLPEWLATNNKLIFGWLFAAAELFLVWRWLAG
ncbi:MAG: hypothetical protein KDJ88_05190 [Bauldia sp.]|nr:hypothetical protein [Bauldia sp.]